MHLPVGVRHLNVLVAGYFEPRWRTSRWECSFDTMRRQIRQQQSCTKWNRRGLATVRFSGFISVEGSLFASDLRQILANLVGDWSKMSLCDIVLVELLIEKDQLRSVHQSVLFHFLYIVGMHVPFVYSKFLNMVVVGGVPMFVVMDIPIKAPQDDLHRIISECQIRDPAVMMFHVRKEEHMVLWAELLKDTKSFSSTCFHFVFFEWDPLDVYQSIVTIARALAKPPARRNTWAPWYGEHMPHALEGMWLYCSVRDRDSIKAPDGWKAQRVQRPEVALYVEGWLVKEFTTERGWNVTKHDNRKTKPESELLRPHSRSRVNPSTML